MFILPHRVTDVIRMQVVNRKVTSIQWLRDAPSEVSRHFSQAAKTMTASQVEALCRRTVAHMHVQEWGWAADGEYLPLDVWSKRGYNADDIAAKAFPEDKRKDPTYGWDLYRVRVHKTHEAEKHATKDSLDLLAKSRTRALKRRRTDESELPIPSKSSSSSSFSEEASASESEESKKGKKSKKSKGKKEKQDTTKGKAKGKAKAAAADKAKTKVKAAAKKDLSKVSSALRALRTASAHQLLLDVDEDIVKNVRDSIKSLAAMEKLCERTILSGVDEHSCELQAFNWKNAKEHERLLKKKLAKLEKVK